MAELTIRLGVPNGPRVKRGALSALLMLIGVPNLGSESVTLTTYYPAPSGVYTNMITTGNTFLARDGGSVGVGTATPGTKLDVVGTFRASGSATFNNGVTGSFGLTPGYVNWATYGTGAGGAAIYNDAGSYNALMIVGNTAGGGSRRVKVWDELRPQGDMIMEASSYKIDMQGNSTIVSRKNDCSIVSYSPGGGAGVTNCPGGNYATLISGLMTKYQMINIGTEPQGRMLCCPCPGGSCPGL
jgi:hypothetical protein